MCVVCQCVSARPPPQVDVRTTRLTLKNQVEDIVKSIVSMQGAKEEENGESE